MVFSIEIRLIYPSEIRMVFPSEIRIVFPSEIRLSVWAFQVRSVWSFQLIQVRFDLSNFVAQWASDYPHECIGSLPRLIPTSSLSVSQNSPVDDFPNTVAQ